MNFWVPLQTEYAIGVAERLLLSTDRRWSLLGMRQMRMLKIWRRMTSYYYPFFKTFVHYTGSLHSARNAWCFQPVCRFYQQRTLQPTLPRTALVIYALPCVYHVACGPYLEKNCFIVLHYERSSPKFNTNNARLVALEFCSGEELSFVSPVCGRLLVHLLQDVKCRHQWLYL